MLLTNSHRRKSLVVARGFSPEGVTHGGVGGHTEQRDEKLDKGLWAAQYAGQQCRGRVYIQNTKKYIIMAVLVEKQSRGVTQIKHS
jgi:hypothetical protein